MPSGSPELKSKDSEQKKYSKRIFIENVRIYNVKCRYIKLGDIFLVKLTLTYIFLS